MDKYEKLRVVGRGAFGVVHLIQNVTNKELSIMKQIPVDAMTKEERTSALNEVKVLSILNHPNIIKYHENFLEEAALMIVMEYAEGGTLFEFLQSSKGLLDEIIILKYFTQLLLAIQHIHSKQILHRDLKTQNILLDKTKKVVKVVDFGISKMLTKSNAASVVGTPSYISPELCEGKPYNQKSDIWALGCILYEMTTLKKAFEAPNLPAVILKIMRGSFAPPAEHYTSELKDLILRLLRLDPDTRPTANQIMAKPIVINTLLELLDIGSIECSKFERTNQAVHGRHDRSNSKLNSPNMKTDVESPVLHLKPHCKIWCWGNGISTPVSLPLPAADIELSDLSSSRNQKAAVTKNGSMFVWESPPYGTETENQFMPRLLEGQSAVTIQYVSCGDFFIACVTGGDNGNNNRNFPKGGNGNNNGNCVNGNCTNAVMGNFNGNGNNNTDPTRFNVNGNSNGNCAGNCDEAVLGNHNGNHNAGNASNGNLNGNCVGNCEEAFAGNYNGNFNQGDKDTGNINGNCVDRGILMTFGSGANGCLGHGDNNDVGQAKIVEALLGCEVMTVSCGSMHIMAVTNDHEVYGWGKTDGGRLGLGTEDSLSLYKPQLVETLPKDCTPISVVCGLNSSAVLTTEGRIFCTGNNRFNKLGLDSAEAEYNSVIFSFMEISDPILTNIRITLFSIGTSHSAVCTDDGHVYTFGSNQFGQLGIGSTEDTRTIQRVQTLSGVEHISCGDTFTVAVTKDNHVYTWGNKSRGRLGNGDRDALEPGRVDLKTSSLKLVALSASNGGTLVAFGNHAS